MKVYRSIQEIPTIKNAIVTIGSFDGVHKGHQAIITEVTQLAKVEGGESVVVTFDPHPRVVLNPNSDSLKLLTTAEEKIELLHHYGVDNVIVVPFTKEFSQLTPEQYLNDFLLEKLQPKKLVIGFDHSFGKDRAGNIDFLKKHAERGNYEVIEIGEQQIFDIKISSTKIRVALNDGEVMMANDLLGHEYSFAGEVVRGNMIGNTIGFPTANIKIHNKYKLIPRKGVYAVMVKIGNKNYKGMLNIGNRPTIEDDLVTYEVNIFDFNDDIYAQMIKVSIHTFIRKEQKFDSLEELSKQLESDKERALNLL